MAAERWPSELEPAARTTRKHASAGRTIMSLACTECESRNYRTTRKPSQQGQLELKKFCPGCNRHTVHKETK